MAEIPVERKGGGIPWWVWLLLAAIVVALLIWWASAEEDEVETVEPVGVEAVEPFPADGVATNQMAAAGPITDMSMLMPTISEDMVGRQVQLDGVQIQEVVSDIGFWIGPSQDQRIFAVLSQEPTPTTPTEGAADVNPGSTANVSGTIRTRGEILEDMAQGQVMNLPEGVDRFLVIESYRIDAPNQNQ